ncbi:MAG: sulfatase-like hydrolase/transferase, partial [Bacillota bacterium]
FALISLTPAVACIFLEKIMVKITKVFSCLLIGVQALLFAVLLLTPASGMKLPLSDKDLFTFSKNDNIIIFTIDMLDTTYVERAIEEDPELREDLTGFTYYANSSGKFSSTHYSFPVILNGNVNLNSGNPYENENSRQYFQILKDNGYSIEAYGSESLMSEDFVQTLDNNVAYPRMQVNDIPKFTEYLYRLAWFRFLPDITKPVFWFYPDLEFNLLIKTDGEINPYLASNDQFYNKLTSDQITLKDSGNSFKSYYIFGNHFPYNTDAQCRFVRPEVPYFETTKGMMLVIRELCAQLKAAGIYDNTTIVITGDHGWIGAHAITAPALLIKPKGSTGDLVVSDTPVDHTVIVPTILESMGFDGSEFGSSAFEGLTGRLYYKSGLKIVEGDVGTLLEYLVPDASNDPLFYEPTGFKYDTSGSYISIYSYHDYNLGQRLDLSGSCDYFDLGFADGQAYGAQSHLTMNISAPKELHVTIKLSSHFGDAQRIIAECAGQVVYEGVVTDTATINFTIPAACIEDGRLLLKLRYPDAVSQRQLDNDSDDATLYSFDFYELIIN